MLKWCIRILVILCGLSIAIGIVGDMLELGIMISVILFGPVVAIVIMEAMTVKIEKAKQLKEDQISDDIED